MKILDRLQACGYEAYAVGGCVRDLLLQRTPHDWDVCTDALPRQVADSFTDMHVIETGLQHGTVTVVADKMPVEITTYRIDEGYADHRRPDHVRFTRSLKEDLARRDFTINAMAFHPSRGMVDCFGGRADLSAGIVRCVGNADARFTEDALRMLRALRFASRYGFTVEEQTGAALLRHQGDLCYVAVERILSEIVRTDFARVDTKYLPVYRVVIPQLQHMDIPKNLPDDPAIRMAALLHGLDARGILARLKASNALRYQVATLADRMDTPIPADAVAIKHLLREIGPQAAGQLLALQQNAPAQSILRQILAHGDAYSLKQLAINGSDLQSIGLTGKSIGQTLHTLLIKVMDGAVPNERAALLAAAEEIMRQ